MVVSKSILGVPSSLSELIIFVTMLLNLPESLSAERSIFVDATFVASLYSRYLLEKSIKSFAFLLILVDLYIFIVVDGSLL